jgi:hypothetical protein
MTLPASGGTSEKGKKVPGEKLCARTRFQTAPSLNKFGLLAKREILPTNHTNGTRKNRLKDLLLFALIDVIRGQTRLRNLYG